ncbi:TPA: acyltransferase family protein [Citrobacter farmeri]|nr:acyltransferase [Citrobacter farmeri]
MGKIYTLQILRAFAALCVVVSHVWGINGKIGKPLGFDYIGGYGVDIFFVISGFIMCYTIKDVFDNPRRESFVFIAKRILRIYPVYIILAIPVIIYFSSLAIESGKDVSLYMIIGNLLLLPTFTQNPSYHMYFYVAWSLCYEMMFYAVFAFIMLFTKNKNSLIAIMVVLLVSMVALVNTFKLQGKMLGWVNITYMIGDSLMINFALGCIAFVIYRAYRNVSLKPIVSILIVAILFYIGIVNAQHQVLRIFKFGIPSFLIVLTMLYTKIEDHYDDKVFTKFCIYLGNASYSIYLVHLYVVFIMPKIYTVTPLNKDITGAIMSVFAALMGCLFYSGIEKPLNKFIHLKIYTKLARC